MTSFLTSTILTLLLCLQLSWCLGKGKKTVDSDPLRKYSTLIELKGGTFEMGAGANRKDNPTKSKAYGRKVTVKPFALDAFPVTNGYFRKFVREKKFNSEAEQFGWSFVFHDFVPEKIRITIKQSVQVSKLTT